MQDEEGPVLRKLEEMYRKIDARDREAKPDYWVRILATAAAGFGTLLLGLAAIITVRSC